MATFFMFGKYSAEAIKGANAARTKKAMQVIQKCGGKVRSVHALLGCNDLVLVVDFPGVPEVMKASIGLTKATGIGFHSEPALSIEEFDKLL